MRSSCTHLHEVMPKQRKKSAAMRGKRHSEPAGAGVQKPTSGLRSLKDRLSMIRFRLWRANNQANSAAQQPAPGETRAVLSLRQRLGSSLGGSYRFVVSRLALLRHLHPTIKGRGMCNTSHSCFTCSHFFSRALDAVATRPMGPAWRGSLLDVGEGEQRTSPSVGAHTAL